jgi:membrane protein
MRKVWPVRLWPVLKSAAYGFVQDEALSRGAAIAYYTIFAIGPVLLIVVGMVGLFFGRQATEGAIVGQLSGLMGTQSAKVVQDLIQSASRARASWIATAVGLGTLVITASGVFSEMQTALNVIWKAPPPKESTWIWLLKARAVGLGLVAAMGFL